jgi:hypothetical protein
MDDRRDEIKRASEQEEASCQPKHDVYRASAGAVSANRSEGSASKIAARSAGASAPRLDPLGALVPIRGVPGRVGQRQTLSLRAHHRPNRGAVVPRHGRVADLRGLSGRLKEPERTGDIQLQSELETG